MGKQAFIRFKGKKKRKTAFLPEGIVNLKVVPQKELGASEALEEGCGGWGRSQRHG